MWLAASRFWWQEVGGRVIAVVLDNTTSMLAQPNSTLMEKFVLEFLHGLDGSAKILFVLVEPSVAPPCWQKLKIDQRLLTKNQALWVVLNVVVHNSPQAQALAADHKDCTSSDTAKTDKTDDMDQDLPENVWTGPTRYKQDVPAVFLPLSSLDDSFAPHDKANCLFYSGRQTPLVQCLLGLVNRGYRLIVCPTDGGENVVRDNTAFRAEKLLQLPIGTVMDRYNHQLAEAPQQRGTTGRKRTTRRKTTDHAEARRLVFDSWNILRSLCEVKSDPNVCSQSNLGSPCLGFVRRTSRISKPAHFACWCPKRDSVKTHSRFQDSQSFEPCRCHQCGK